MPCLLRRLRRLCTATKNSASSCVLLWPPRPAARWSMRIRARLEVVAEVRAFLVLHFLSDGLTAMLRDRSAVPLAQLADMQLGAALAAFFQPPQRQRVVRERMTAFPADEFGHGR